MAGDTSRNIVGGLENGLSVIEAFSEGRQRMSITEISEVTGLTRAASRRYLLTLVHLGYAEHDGKFFSLTPRVLGLGYAYLSSITLPARIQPFLERVSEVLSEFEFGRRARRPGRGVSGAIGYAAYHVDRA